MSTPTIQIIDDRFVLEPGDPLVGGTSHVYKARDHRDRGTVAVKLYDGPAIDESLRKESYLRERDALTALEHPNIVRLIRAGFDPSRQQHYVALEWLDEHLLHYIQRRRSAGDSDHPAASWAHWARVMLEPLLEALGVAHARRILHRDIKPHNVLIAPDGRPKLADFGLAKLLDSLREGYTIRDFHSRPYAAPEAYGGEVDARSDLYSLGITSLRCLLPEEFDLRDDNTEEAVAALTIDADGRYFLAGLVASDPDDRPLTSRLALADLRRTLHWAPATPSAHRARLLIHLTHNVKKQVMGVVDEPTEDAARLYIVGDLADDVVVEWVQPTAGTHGGAAYNLVAGDLSYRAVLDDGARRLSLVSAIELPSHVLERKRDAGLRLEHQIVFEGQWDRQQEDLDHLLEQVAEHRAEEQRRAVELAEQAVFDRWLAILDAKTELETLREDALPYDGFSAEAGTIDFRITRELDETYVGQTRRVQTQNGALVGTVTDVSDEGLTLGVERGNVDGVPQSGRLTMDRRASQVAIDRQRHALRAVREGTALRSDMAHLLLNLRDLSAAEPADVASFFQDIDEPKQDAVRRGLASPDFTVIHGPPGTGKTTFIAELVCQLKERSPRARIVLSSQTHVAVDNAAVRLAKLMPDLRIVRTGLAEKVDVEAQHLTVAAQLRRWRDEASAKARRFLEEWATERGIESTAVQAYADAGELSLVSKSLQRLEARLRELVNEEDVLLERLTDPAREAPSAGESSSDLVQDEQDELRGIEEERAEKLTQQRELQQRDAQLRQRLCSGLDVHELPDLEELPARLASQFQVNEDELQTFRNLVDLQDDWLLRFGQSQDFQRALVNTADVVAGTCVGLASVIGDTAEFDLAIVDEASKATPTEALIPLIRSRRWVLVGDSKQLPPFLDTALRDEGLLERHELSEADLRHTLFDRLVQELPGDRQAALLCQHRMLGPIGDLVSHCFYDDALSSSRGNSSEYASVQRAFPCPVTWISTSRDKGRFDEKVGTTYWNRREVEVIEENLNALQFYASQCGERLSVGIITGYAEQARRIRRALRPRDGKWTSLDIDIHPVDSFQGQQRKVIVYSVTRSNKQRKLGFLRVPERLNVALSRGQEALLIVGDAEFCETAEGGRSPFKQVLEYVRGRDGCAVVRAADGQRL